MNREQLGKLILASEDTMYHIAKTMLYSDADCADAIQETIVRAFSKVHTLRQDAYARTWLIRILINECYAIMRREKKKQSAEALLREQTMLKHQEKQTEYSELYEALQKLPEDMRLAVTLYYVEGYCIRDIAALQKTTESAVKNRLLKARSRIRRELEEKGAV